MVFPEKWYFNISILIHVLSRRQQKNQSLCFHYWDFLTNFWCNNWRSIIDVVEKICYRAQKTALCTIYQHRYIKFNDHSWLTRYPCNFFNIETIEALFRLFTSNPIYSFEKYLCKCKCEWVYKSPKEQKNTVSTQCQLQWYALKYRKFGF